MYVCKIVCIHFLKVCLFAFFYARIHVFMNVAHGPKLYSNPFRHGRGFFLSKASSMPLHRRMVLQILSISAFLYSRESLSLAYALRASRRDKVIRFGGMGEAGAAAMRAV